MDGLWPVEQVSSCDKGLIGKYNLGFSNQGELFGAKGLSEGVSPERISR